MLNIKIQISSAVSAWNAHIATNKYLYFQIQYLREPNYLFQKFFNSFIFGHVNIHWKKHIKNQEFRIRPYPIFFFWRCNIFVRRLIKFISITKLAVNLELLRLMRLLFQKGNIMLEECSLKYGVLVEFVKRQMKFLYK